MNDPDRIGREHMKPLQESPWMQRGLYFLAGVVIASLCLVLQFKWMDLVPYGGFDDQPRWLKRLLWIVGWLPWLVFVAVVVLRFRRGRHVRVGAYFLGTITPGAFLIASLLFGPTIDEFVHFQKFDAEAWQNQESGEHDIMWPPRLCMVDDLLRSGRLWGKTQEEVIELLGPPAPKGFPFGANECDVHYYLGPDRGLFRIDSEWLLLKFGEDRELSRQWLYQD
jgi:hypothetical protein